MRRYCALLLLTLLLLTGCGAAAQEDDPLAIREFVIGSSAATIETETHGLARQYIIHIALPIETDFQRCAVNLVLAEGASLSGDSPCLVTELAGRPVIDLTCDQRTLIVENGGRTRVYSLVVDLAP